MLSNHQAKKKMSRNMKQFYRNKDIVSVINIIVLIVFNYYHILILIFVYFLYFNYFQADWADGIVWSIYTTDWTVQGSNPGVARCSRQV